MITIKQGDSHNALVSSISRNGVNIDLTGCEVYITVEDIIYKERCNIVEAKEGVVSYLFGKIAHTSGYYSYEYYIKYPDGTGEYVPNNKHEIIHVYKNIKEW